MWMAKMWEESERKLRSLLHEIDNVGGPCSALAVVFILRDTTSQLEAKGHTHGIVIIYSDQKWFFLWDTIL